MEAAVIYKRCRGPVTLDRVRPGSRPQTYTQKSVVTTQLKVRLGTGVACVCVCVCVCVCKRARVLACVRTPVLACVRTLARAREHMRV